MKTVLLFGCDGFLGNRIFKSNIKDYDFIGTSRNISVRNGEKVVYFDANDLESIDKILFLHKPSLVINCIALTDVEECEHNHSKSRFINTVLPEYLASATSHLNIKFVHISTDHFKSEYDNPRLEHERIEAINIYGKNKLEAEAAILRNNTNAIIIRTNFFGFEYGSKNSNLLSKIKSTIESGYTFYGFNDVYFSPISVAALITAIFTLVKENFTGIINVASNESLSKLDFTKLVAQNLCCTEEIIQLSSIKNSNLTTARPHFLSLNNSLYKTITRENIASINDMIKAELDLYKLK